MKPIKRRDVPDPAIVRAAELCVLFARANWTPSSENFEQRPFVQWRGRFFSAAGFPPGHGCHSTCVQTEAEVIAWLESFKAKPEPVDETNSDGIPWASPDVRAALDGIVPIDPALERPSLPSPPTGQDRVEGLGYEDESDPRDEELEALRAENARLKAEFAPWPDPREKLSDWDPEAIGPDIEAEKPPIPASVAKLMAEDASLTLTAAFEKRINTLNNARLNLTIQFEEEAELDLLLTQYHDLAKRGDRS